MRKINVVVLMGGKSPEHEISVISGSEVTRNLDKKKYNILPIIISKDGLRWLSISTRKLLSLPDPIKLKGTKKEVVVVESKNITSPNEVKEKSVDVVFIAMHGPYGEDGTVQGLLEMAGLTYTGSGVLASALGMDKVAFRKIMKSEAIPIPKYIELRKGEDVGKIYKTLGKLPYFVKPASQGSSVGISIVKKRRDLKKAMDLAFTYGSVVLVDEYIKGTEVTCAILGNENPIPLQVVEIVPKKGEFFDYESKYAESGSEEIVPARISNGLTKKIQQIALRVYKTVGCRGFARVDFLIRANNQPVVLEINTIPGLTPMSLFPKAAKAVGISYGQLLDKIINLATQK